MAFTIKQNDTSPSLQATLKGSSGSAINLSGASVSFHMKPLGGDIKVDSPMSVTDASEGVVRYDWGASDTDTVGTYFVEFEVTYSDNSVETFPNSGNLVVNVVRQLN
jgi:hypothetical protein